MALMKLSIAELYKLHGAHAALDGMRMVENPETKKLAQIRDAYVFSTQFRMKDRANRKAIRAALEGFEQNRTNIALKITGAEQLPADNHPKAAEFNKAILPHVLEKIEVELARYTIADFNLDENKTLPMGVLDGLDCLIDDGTSDAAKAA